MKTAGRVFSGIILGIAAATAAGADFSFIAGGGMAWLDVGTPRRSFVATSPTSESAPLFRVGGEWRAEPGLGVGLDFSSYGSAGRTYATDYSQGIPVLVPHTALDYSLQAGRLGLFYDWRVSPSVTLRPVAGVVWSQLDSTWKGGQEAALSGSESAIGYHLGISVAGRWGERLVARLGLELLEPGVRVKAGTRDLSVRQAVLTLEYRL